MLAKQLSLGLVGLLVVAGCQLPHPQGGVVPEPEPLAVVQQACEVVPPKVVEVPVPVPMPCQLKEEPFEDQAVALPKRAKTSIATGAFNAVQQYPYVEGGLYQGRVAVGHNTAILLDTGEYFNQAVLGDKERWSVGELTAGSGETVRGGVVVGCAEVGTKTSLAITGSKHLYLVELRCTSSTGHAAISWSYAGRPVPGMLQGARPSAPGPGAPAPLASVPDAPSRTQYVLKSNREAAWMPTHVYDTGVEGQQTYLVFPRVLSTTDAPVLYVRTVEGTQALVNYRSRQGYYIADRIWPQEAIRNTRGGMGDPLTYYQVDSIADHWELRVGEQKPTIVTVTRQGP